MSNRRELTGIEPFRAVRAVLTSRLELILSGAKPDLSVQNRHLRPSQSSLQLTLFKFCVA